MKHPGGGRYDPDEGFCYFVAGQSLDDIQMRHRHTLFAFDKLLAELGGLNAGHLDEFEMRLSDPEHRMMLDSGVFGLANRHAAKTGISLPEALRLPPEEIEGFDWLYQGYIEFVSRFEDRLWGYIEIDQGGADRKREIRRRLEADGLLPIPVYHPLGDGWAYFDELASSYDRIAVGNLVTMSPPLRKRVLATLWERRRRHPGLRWIHLLGYTPAAAHNSYPCESTDSSALVYTLRYGSIAGPGAVAMNQSFAKLDRGFSYVTVKTEDEATDANAGADRKKAIDFLAMQGHFMQHGTRTAAADAAEAYGQAVLPPPPFPGEAPPTPLKEVWR